LGGEIWLESQEGIEAFYFSLPLAVKNKGKKSQTNRIQKKEKELPKIKKKLKMLIADDDIISRKLILKSVHEFAKEIIKQKGVKQLKIQREHNVDLILIDVQMPDINGYEATKEIRELNSDVIIITQSAFGLNGQGKALSAGSNDYITKPIDKTELLIVLNKYFS
jgi:CheY-like chemotaxis protein